ncbi:MAG: 2-oxoacid:acceptor oxidoreductase family protein [Candidatus Aenigmatarchaeota archaeon]
MNFLFVGHTEQGVATTARLIARAVVASGLKAQLYLPEPERPGDGRKAYLRLAKPKEELLEKGPISAPDFVLVFDAGMVKEKVKDLKERSVIIVNSKERFTSPLLAKKKVKVLSIDATGIALSATGRPFPAAPMAGALSKAFPKLSLKVLRSAIEAEFYGHVAEHQSAAEQGCKMAKW